MINLNFPLPIFRNAKEIVSGENARYALKGIKSNTTAIICSSHFQNSNYFEQILKLTKSENVQFFLKDWFGDITLEKIKGISSKIFELKPDLIIAIGGGSIIDAAKVIWAKYECPEMSDDLLFRPFSLNTLRSCSKFVAIPTTVGTGSEVSSSAVVLDPKSGSKKAIVTHQFLPDVVILDPNLALEVPITIQIETAADALTHSIEGYTSKIINPLMDYFAEQSVNMIARQLKKLLIGEINISTISELQIAAMFAGWVQNHCLVGMSHAIAHQLAPYNFSHGAANAILMPWVLEFNSKDENIRNRYSLFAKKIGVGDDVNDLIKIFDSVKPFLNLPKNLQDKFDCESISKNALLDPNAKVNPKIFNESDVVNVLKNAYK
tara:strand:+ start:114 stop:1247 length:1134 start_codon:yes stop_codon:yes gene_type:complete